MKAIKVRQGSTKTLTVEYGDPQAVSATLTVKEFATDFAPLFTPITGNFSSTLTGGKYVAVLDIDNSVTESLPIGDYLYQVTILYADGEPKIFPDPIDCDDCFNKDSDCDESEECKLPPFVVCVSLSGGIS